MSGSYTTSYWLPTFVWDQLISLIPITAAFIIFAYFQIEGYTGEGLAAVLALYVSLSEMVHVYMDDIYAVIRSLNSKI